MKFGSLFAGICGFDLGFKRAGMQCAWQVDLYHPDRSPYALADYEAQLRAAKDELETARIKREWRELNRYGAALLECANHHFPDVVRINDVRMANAQILESVDVICGGFPCQDLSVAGKRLGLQGARSGLFFEMTRITNELKPAFLVWENVPGLLSSNSGRDFGAVLMELERIGYRGCWTTLDAQWFGVAQRRCRVFGVFARGDIGAASCAEILSFPARMSRNFEAREATGQKVASTLDASPPNDGVMDYTAIVFNTRQDPITSDVAQPLNAKDNGQGILVGAGVRRLTPTECERLQGFPDGWTKGFFDSVRYRMLGNGVVVPCVEWLGKRIMLNFNE